MVDAGAHQPAVQRRQFGKFAQADSSDTRQKGGTGLGLSIAEAPVEKMRGRIGFESGPGKGSISYVELPTYPEPVNVAAAIGSVV